MSGRRINGEGSIYPYPHGYRAHVWVTTPSGRRQRKYVAGKTREEVREKYLKLHEASRRGPVTTKVPTLAQSPRLGSRRSSRRRWRRGPL